MKKVLNLFFCLVVLAACSTSQKLEEREHEDIKRSYEVRDASSNTRPGWIEDPNIWAKNNSLDVGTYRFYSYETIPTVDRSVACKMAKTQAKSEIAGEISTYIKERFGSYVEGELAVDESNPNLKAMERYVETSLTSDIEARVHGAAIEKKYWEKRNYLEDLNAPKDYIAFTCAVLVKIKSKMVEELVERAKENIVKQIKNDNKLKQKVEDNLKKLDMVNKI